MCELKLIKLAWADVESYMRKYNVTGDLSLKTIQEMRIAKKSITECRGRATLIIKNKWRLNCDR